MKKLLISLLSVLMLCSCSKWTPEGKTDREIVEHYSKLIAKQRTKNHSRSFGIELSCVLDTCSTSTYVTPKFKIEVLSISNEPVNMYRVDMEEKITASGGKFVAVRTDTEAYKVSYKIKAKESDRYNVIQALAHRTSADFEWDLATNEIDFKWSEGYFTGLYDGIRVNEDKTLGVCYLREYQEAEGRLRKIIEQGYDLYWENFQSGRIR